MSKRKYAENVSSVVYGFEHTDKTMGYDAQFYKERMLNVPVRIVREAFYRKLIRDFEYCECEREWRMLG